MESARISQVIEEAKRCAQAGALARARALYGSSAPCCVPKTDPNIQVPAESTYQNGIVADCSYNFVRAPVLTARAWTADLQQRVLDAYNDPLDPTRRFMEFQGPFIPPACPPIVYLSANPSQMKSCPLDNKPFNPVLPG
jgi:hypothetical protein